MSYTTDLLANLGMPGEEKLRALRLVAGRPWDGQPIGTGRANNLSNVIHRALRLTIAKEPASSLRGGVCRIWRSPSDAPHRYRHQRRYLLASTGLDTQASEAECSQLVPATSDQGEVAANGDL